MLIDPDLCLVLPHALNPFIWVFFWYFVCPSSEDACIFFDGNSDVAYQTGSKKIPAPPLKASKLNPSSVKLG